MATNRQIVEDNQKKAETGRQAGRRTDRDRELK